MSKGAKNPDRTGQRCIVCYAWEVRTEDGSTKITHEGHCLNNLPRRARSA